MFQPCRRRASAWPHAPAAIGSAARRRSETAAFEMPPTSPTTMPSAMTAAASRGPRLGRAQEHRHDRRHQRQRARPSRSRPAGSRRRRTGTPPAGSPPPPARLRGPSPRTSRGRAAAPPTSSGPPRRGVACRHHPPTAHRPLMRQFLGRIGRESMPPSSPLRTAQKCERPDPCGPGPLPPGGDEPIYFGLTPKVVETVCPVS